MQRPTSYSSSVSGVLQALPIVAGYIPVGLAYGILAQQAGLSVLATGAMSLCVFAGSAQFIALSLVMSGQSAAAIVATTFVVNLRHLLMASAIAPYLSRWPTGKRILCGLELTDETFAVHSAQFLHAVPPARHIFAVNVTAHAAWVIGGLLGFVAGRMITDVKPFGLDYTLAALFIALITLQARNALLWCVGLLAGVGAVAMTLYGFTTCAAIVGTVVAATAGTVYTRWKRA